MGTKITRKAAKVFGQTAGFHQIGVVGSFAAGLPAWSTDPDVIQSLSNFLDGWFSCVDGMNSPAIEDMNALCYLFAYQLGYVLQQGIPEWNATTEYFIGSIVQDGDSLFQSLTDNNINQPRTSAANWKAINSNIRTVTAAETATIYDDYIRLDPTAGTFIETLPSAALTPLGKEITLKNIADNGAVVTVKGFGAELIEWANTLILNSTTAGVGVNESITVKNTGTKWEII